MRSLSQAIMGERSDSCCSERWVEDVTIRDQEGGQWTELIQKRTPRGCYSTLEPLPAKHSGRKWGAAEALRCFFLYKAINGSAATCSVTNDEDDDEHTRGDSDWSEQQDISRSAGSGIVQSQDNPEPCCHQRGWWEMKFPFMFCLFLFPVWPLLACLFLCFHLLPVPSILAPPPSPAFGLRCHHLSILELIKGISAINICFFGCC